jgi:hypothetical protein
LKIPEQETLGCHKLAFVTENRLLEVGTEWLFEQIVQRLVEGHSFSSPLYQIAETEEVAELRVKEK